MLKRTASMVDGPIARAGILWRRADDNVLREKLDRLPGSQS
jgi:hypothetical protein